MCNDIGPNGGEQIAMALQVTIRTLKIFGILFSSYELTMIKK